MSCLETYATLRIFSANIHPSDISKLLNIDASESLPRETNSKYKSRRSYNYWSTTTEKIVDSKDNLEHLNYIIGQLQGKESILDDLRAKGCSTDIYCYWDSNGQGGPFLNCDLMSNLVQLGLEVSWQVYFVDEDEDYA